MRKIQEVLRLHFACGRKNREIATSCGISPSTVADHLQRAERAGVTWEQAKTLTEAELEARLFQCPAHPASVDRAPIDFNWVQGELRHAGVTLQLLWGEYQLGAEQAGRQPYQYSQFCERYRAWCGQRRISMRQTHRPGEKLFIDYSGKRPRFVVPETGEIKEAELYVAVLGASNYTFAEATLSQQLPEFTGSLVRTLEFFGAVPQIAVPDQLRSAVKKPDRYDPDINQVFLECAQHYGMAVIPAPPRTPKGKAKVEVGVLIAQRWILARLRHRVFVSLQALNEAIAELVIELNNRRFAKLPGTRREAFLSIDRPAMKPLPPLRFEIKERKMTRANIDYHVDFDDRYYSVPFQLRQQMIEVRASSAIVELFHRGVRVASHLRSYERKGTSVTAPEHRPKCHEDYGQWPPERMLSWAAKFGSHVEELVRRTMDKYPRPEMGYRPALGILRCAQKHGADRMDAACRRALAAAGSKGVPHRRTIEDILKRGLDRIPLPSPPAPRSGITHENVRGAAYFEQKETHDDRRNNQQAPSTETQRPSQSLQRDAGDATRQTTLF